MTLVFHCMLQNDPDSQRSARAPWILKRSRKNLAKRPGARRSPPRSGAINAAREKPFARNKKPGYSQPSLEPFRTSQSPITIVVWPPLLLLVSVMYFHDKGTNRRVMLIGLMFCTAFVLVSFFARPQPENDRVLVKADRLTLTAGKPPLAN
jgi:hypothetical protein